MVGVRLALAGGVVGWVERGDGEGEGASERVAAAALEGRGLRSHRHEPAAGGLSVQVRDSKGLLGVRFKWNVRERFHSHC